MLREALLAALGIVITYGALPGQVQARRHLDAETILRLLLGVIGNGQLFRLDVSIFVLYFMLTSSFLAIPLVLLHALHIPPGRDGVVYLPVPAVSIVLMVPSILVAEEGSRMREVFLGLSGAPFCGGDRGTTDRRRIAPQNRAPHGAARVT